MKLNFNGTSSYSNDIMKSLIGKKVGMTQVFSDKGDCVPVTLVQVDRCVPILERTMERDGYQAVLVAYGDRKDKHTNKPLKGFYEKHKIAPAKLLTEFRDEAIDKNDVGKPLKVDIDELIFKAFVCCSEGEID